jgi:hypothetical protein
MQSEGDQQYRCSQCWLKVHVVLIPPQSYTMMQCCKAGSMQKQTLAASNSSSCSAQPSRKTLSPLAFLCDSLMASLACSKGNFLPAHHQHVLCPKHSAAYTHHVCAEYGSPCPPVRRSGHGAPKSQHAHGDTKADDSIPCACCLPWCLGSLAAQKVRLMQA